MTSKLVQILILLSCLPCFAINSLTCNSKLPKKDLAVECSSCNIENIDSETLDLFKAYHQSPYLIEAMVLLYKQNPHSIDNYYPYVESPKHLSYALSHLTNLKDLSDTKAFIKLVPRAYFLGKDSNQVLRINISFEYMNHLNEIKKRATYKNCGLSDDELAAIHYYVREGYGDINRFLRSDKNDPLNSYYQYIVSLMNSGLEKIAPYQGYVKRGTNLPSQVRDQHEVGAEITYTAYTSTSISRPFQEKDMFTIFSKTGRYIAPIADDISEEEVLFLPNSRFKVIDRQNNQFTMEEIISN